MTCTSRCEWHQCGQPRGRCVEYSYTFCPFAMRIRSALSLGRHGLHACAGWSSQAQHRRYW